MIVLTVGDVVSAPGLQMLQRMLPALRREFRADLTIVNGENASGTGVTPQQTDQMFAAGADVVTLGNHAFRKRQIVPYIEDHARLLRPANYAPQQPGEGSVIVEAAGKRVLVMDLIGRCEMPFGAENPFLMADKLLQQYQGQYDLALCEIHANATSEKIAMGYYLDGRVAAVWGTHTHVQTADAHVNPKGTGYITDIGMTGPLWSVLGVEPEQSIAMFRGDLTDFFKAAKGESCLSGAVFDIDDARGVCRSVQRIFRRENG